MKKPALCLVLFLGLVPWSYGQTTAKMNFYFPLKFSLRGVKLRTTLNADKPIRIGSNEWVLVETDADSLGLLDREQPFFMPLERGRTYYFLVQSERDNNAALSVRAVTEQEFLLTAHFGGASKPQAYFLRHKPN